MPVVSISVERLNQLLKKQYKMDNLVTALKQLGCDVDGTAKIVLYLCPCCKVPAEKMEKESPPKKCDYCGTEIETPFKKIGKDYAIRLDLLADRPDFFDPGGLSRALKGYLGIEKGIPEYEVNKSDISVNVEGSVTHSQSYRPFISCAVMRISPLDQTGLKEIMRLQENLHWGIGRDRKLASIGIYDLDTIKPPIKYSTVKPTDILFKPLGNPENNMTPKEILEKHPKGIAYSHLLSDFKAYPVLLDSNNQVLSIPPIINSEETKVKKGTDNLFIDVTGLSKYAVEKSLNTLVSSLAELGGKVESVVINYPQKSEQTPDLEPRKITISVKQAKRWLGLDFTHEEFIEYIEKMRLSATQEDEDKYRVFYPAFRTDVKHEVDIFEDIAIGYGFYRIEPKLVPSMTISRIRPEEKQSETIRNIMTGLGFTEIMSLTLLSEEKQFESFRMKPGSNHLIVSNPKTKDQETLRTHMMTGIMETLQKNRRKTVPQKIFELGNVVFHNNKKETGADEFRHLAFAIIAPEIGYADGRAILDSILREIGKKVDYSPEAHPAFCDGRCAKITGEKGTWAILGEIHPEVLNNFSLAYPVVYGEIRLIQVI